MNQNCTRCTTFAFAYQYVVTTRDDFHLSGDARRQIAGIRHQAYDVAHSDLAPADMDARLNALATEFKSDIDGDLANQNERHHGQVKRDDEAPPAS